MRRATILFALLLALVACTDSTPSYNLSGRYGNGGDTIFVFGLDSRHNRLDTILTDENGKFNYTVKSDTLIPLTLVLPDGTMLPLYAEPNINGTLTNDSTGKSIIKGGTTQELYDSIASKIEMAGEKSNREAVIDAFIATHPMSEINIELLRQHFIEIPNAKNSFIRTRIEKLGGTLQDNDYLAAIKDKVKIKSGNIVHKAFPDFKMTTAEGKDINRSHYLKKHTIVTFWASWDKGSIERLKRLSEIAQKNDTAEFALLNISLDYDTAAWRHCINNDTIIGDNVCDAMMWENEIAKDFTIETLPFSLQMNPFLRVDKYGLIADEKLEAEIDTLINNYNNNEKKKEKRRIERTQKMRAVTQKEKKDIIKRGGFQDSKGVTPASKIIKPTN